MKDDGGFLVANALENRTDIDWFANWYTNNRCYRGLSDLEKMCSSVHERRSDSSTDCYNEGARATALPTGPS
jgi:hypothetical protein